MAVVEEYKTLSRDIVEDAGLHVLKREFKRELPGEIDELGYEDNNETNSIELF